MATRRRIAHDDEILEALVYLGHEVRQQRIDFTAQFERLSGRVDAVASQLDRLNDEFQAFRMEMTRDFTRLNTQVQTGVKVGWAVTVLLAGIFVTVLVAVLTY